MTGATILERPPVFWRCPSCGVSQRTKDDGTTRMHECGGLSGLTAPLVRVADLDDKPDARHLVLEREDYIADSGMPRIMAVHTDHGDGSNDRTVFAPTAVLRLGGFGNDSAVAASAGLAAAQARMRHRGFSDHEIARAARIAKAAGMEMAWSTSAVFAFAVLQMGSKALNLTSDSYKVALYGNSGTPDKTVATAVLTEYNGSGSQWVTANEASGTGYSAGGVSVTPITLTQASNVVTFTSSGTPQWTVATFTTYGCLVYDTSVSNEGLTFNYFGGAQTVAAGTFTIAWSGSGIATWTC